LFFLGGWQVNIVFLANRGIPQTIIFSIKIRLFVTRFILVRGTLPRYRYDQLRRLGWKVFLPISLAFILFYSSILLGTNGLLDYSRI
jgi:NADH-quinone oxidoreductase subunit H